MPTAAPSPLSRRARYGVLLSAFLAWFFAGVQMSITPLVSNSVTIDLLGTAAPMAGPSAGPSAGQDAAATRSAVKEAPKAVLTRWYSRYNATFLFGAAAGGVLFGWVGDCYGRSRALGLSICCYSLFSGVAAFVPTAELYLVCRFVGCLGVGGAWPNAIALVTEVWDDVSRPLLSGVIGTAANVGLVAIGLLACFVQITAESWRWVMLLGGSPIVVGLAVLALTPESPKWLASRKAASDATIAAATGAQAKTPVGEVFRPPWLAITLLGIVLGTIPLFGGWGCTNWLVPWSDQVGARLDPGLKARTQVARSVGAAVTSLIGGWVTVKLGRRLSFFLFSLTSLIVGQYIFQALDPTHPWFNFFVFLLGTTTGFYFGWLPLCLPEMYPTRIRSTGSGVTFNFGRVATGLGVLGAGWLSTLAWFDGDYAKVGAVTSLVFAFGLVAIWFLPVHKPTPDVVA